MGGLMMSACRNCRFTIALFILSLLATTVSQAQCPQADQVEVTLLKGRTGNVMTLCVPPAAIDHIGGQSDIVIPAVCPSDMTVLEPISEWLSALELGCFAHENEYGDFVTIEALLWDGESVRVLEAAWSWSEDRGRSVYADYGSYWPPHYYFDDPLASPAEARACAAAIWGFAVRELGLDCVGEFPDFEPNTP